MSSRPESTVTSPEVFHDIYWGVHSPYGHQSADNRGFPEGRRTASSPGSVQSGYQASHQILPWPVIYRRLGTVCELCVSRTRTQHLLGACKLCGPRRRRLHGFYWSYGVATVECGLDKSTPNHRADDSTGRELINWTVTSLAYISGQFYVIYVWYVDSIIIF